MLAMAAESVGRMMLLGAGVTEGVGAKLATTLVGEATTMEVKPGLFNMIVDRGLAMLDALPEASDTTEVGLAWRTGLEDALPKSVEAMLSATEEPEEVATGNPVVAVGKPVAVGELKLFETVAEPNADELSALLAAAEAEGDAVEDMITLEADWNAAEVTLSVPVGAAVTVANTVVVTTTVTTETP